MFFSPHFCCVYCVTPWPSSLFGPGYFSSFLKWPFCPLREFLLQRGIMLRTPLWPAELSRSFSLSLSLRVLHFRLFDRKRGLWADGPVCVYVCRRGNTLWTPVKTFSDDWSLERITNSFPLVWQMSPLDKCFRNSLITTAYCNIM